MNLKTKLSNFYRADSQPPKTLIICLPNPSFDALTLCGYQIPTHKTPDEILSSSDFDKSYGHTYTWEHWNELKHQWQLEGYEIFESQNIKNFHNSVLVLYYSPLYPDFIANDYLGYPDPVLELSEV